MEFSKSATGWSLSGEIAGPDATRFTELLAAIGQGPGEVTLNLAGLTNVSSSAVRLWLDFKRQLQARQLRVVLTECSSAFIDIANIYDEILRDTRVTSLFLPVECVHCENPHEILIAAPSPQAKSLGLPRCATCSEELHPLIDADDYFACLQRN